MGDPKKLRKQFEKPRKVWDAERLQTDRKLKQDYGLKNMREIWKVGMGIPLPESVDKALKAKGF